jgi:hypothetical protein
MASARTQCPQCLRSPDVDYFHCMDCKRMWNVPKGKDGPPDPAQKPPRES